MLDSSTLSQKLAAEAVGTLLLVLLGCGFFAVTGAGDQGSAYATPLTFGFTLVALMFAFGRISGGHFNPAISVGAGLSGRLAWRDVAAYAGAQLAGGLAAGALLLVILHGFENFDAGETLGQSYYGDQGLGFAVWAALLVELVLTALFVTIFLAATDARNEQRALAPLAIGLAFSACYFFSLPMTGGGMNPARSIGVGVFAGSGALAQLWLFVLAPLVGALAAGLGYPLLFGRDAEPVAGSGLRLGRGTPAAVPGYGAGEQYQQQWNQQAAPQPDQQAAPEAEQAWTLEQAAAQGWHWDEQAQQWRHVSEGYQPGQQGWAQEPQQQWPEPGQDDGHTQVRRPPEQ